MVSEGVVVVTGGNRGIGLELCKALVACGKDVILTGRNAAAVSKAAMEVCNHAQHGGKCRPETLDVSDASSIEAVVQRLSCSEQRVAALVNNAAVYDAAWSQTAWNHSYRTNYMGPVLLTQALLPIMSDGARIIMLSSLWAKPEELPAYYSQQIQSACSLGELSEVAFDKNEGVPNGMYRVTKAMLNRAAQLLQNDGAVRSRRITIMSVSPGWCRTDMAEEVLPDMEAPRTAQQGGAALLSALECSPHSMESSLMTLRWMDDGKRKLPNGTGEPFIWIL